MQRAMVDDVRDLHQMVPPDHVPRAQFGTLVLLCCWRLWKRRNKVVFDGDRVPLPRVLSECREDAKLWSCRFGRDGLLVRDAWCLVFAAPH